jgi:hypothetical protein
MRPVLPVLSLAMLVALPAAAGHHHAASSHGGGRGAGSTAASIAPSALNTPFDYGTGDALSPNAGTTTTITTPTDGPKAAKAAKDDLAGYNLPNTGAARKHGKAQALPAY